PLAPASRPDALHASAAQPPGRETQGPAHGVPLRAADRHEPPPPRAAAAPGPREAPRAPAPQRVAAHARPTSEPVPHPQAAPHGSPPAPHEASRAPAPERIAMQAPHAAPQSGPHPQPAPHAPPPAPREPPRPAAQPPHEPPHTHPAPAQPAPAHGGEKAADHGHKHGEQGGH
ncbi:hypothetical protein ACFQ1A_18010, partial [Massilia pinisoli]